MMRNASALLCAVALGACSLIPDYEPPVVEAAESWINAGAEIEARQAEPPPADWWRAFGNEELARLVARAQANSPDLAAATARVAQASATRRAAASTLLPSIGGSASGSRSGQDFDTFGTSADRVSWRGVIDASYEIDFWGRNRAGAIAAEASELASAFDRDTVLLSLSAEVAATWLQYLAIEDRIDVAQANLDNARIVLELIETRVDLGAVSPLELAQQRSTIAGIEASLSELRQQRAQTLNALALLLGEPPGEIAVGSEGLSAVRLPVVQPGLPSELLTRRPDIARAEAQLLAANADIGAARAAYFPSIGLTGQAGFGSTALASLFEPASALYTLAGSITAPIFSGGRLDAEYDRARARYDELVANYRGAVLAGFRDVEDALAAARYLAEVEAAQQEAATQAAEAFRLAETQYRAGAVDFLTVLDAQRSLFSAEDALVRARLARLDAAVSLYRALGGGWSDPRR